MSTTSMTLTGDAIALGEETLAAVSTILNIVDRGPVTIGTGEVTALAATEDGYAGAETDATATGDIIIVKTRGKSGNGYEMSVTKIKVIDIQKIDGATKFIYNEQDFHEENYTIGIDGNVAIASFDGQAIGESTLVDVDAFALAIEDELSMSAVVTTAAVG